MKDVHMLGVHPDGNQLILSDDAGNRYSLPLTDQLRDACKPASSLRAVTPRHAGAPSPREIQQLVRAGATPEEIARDFDISIEKVRRYEGPILAERAHAAAQARTTPIGADTDSPTLGDLVVDRLAARGVSPSSITWDAIRAGHSKPWEVIVRFVQNAEEREAHWSVETSGRGIAAVDEEAAWLTERTTPAGPSRGHIAPTTIPTRPPSSASSESTEEILDMLASQRGVRQEVDLSEFDDEERPPTAPAGNRVLSFAPPAQVSPTPDRVPETPAPDPAPSPAPADHEDTAGDPSPTPGAPAPAPAPPVSEAEEDESPSTDPLPGLENLDAGAPSSPRAHRRARTRQSVPSWEEIMFGSQPK